MSDQPTNVHEAYSAARRILPTLAVLVLVGALLRVWFLPTWAERLDSTTLVYVAVAAALFLARQIKSLAFGDYKVEFETAKRIAEDALSTAQDAQANSLGTGKRPKKRSAAGDRLAPRPGDVHDDPWKGVFGEHSEVNSRRLTAQVSGDDGWYRITLAVRSTDPIHHQLTGAVQFFLHNSFDNDRPIVTVNHRGEARLTVYAYGAFTVGAIADDGKTKLELDLATLQNAPKAFREQ